MEIKRERAIARVSICPRAPARAPISDAIRNDRARSESIKGRPVRDRSCAVAGKKENLFFSIPSTDVSH